jgi:uncharacterized protein RhaS with RHS repeats
MPFRFSRRGFVGGLFAALLAAFRTPKAPAAASPAPPPESSGATTCSFDGRGRVIASTDPLGHVTTTVYDPQGTALWTNDALGHTTTYFYDAEGRRTNPPEAGTA